ncbi:MAG: hypothetical protein ABII02_00465 [Candidatus Magasanikbacteria bacterium]
MIRSIVIILVVLSVNFLTADAKAQYGFVEFQAQAESGLFVPTVDLLVGGTIAKTRFGTLGVEGFALVSDGWAELYAGPTWTIIPELTIGLFAGMETGPETLPRFATTVIVNYEEFSFFGAVEFNTRSFDGEQTGLWYRLVATGSATSWLKVGVEWRRFAGLGPHVAVKIPETPVGLWVSWMPLEPEGLDGNIVNLDRFLLGGKVGF